MQFGEVIPGDVLAQIGRPRRQETKKSSRRFREFRENLPLRLASASLKYTYSSAEFLDCVGNPAAGQSIGAPDNWSMAELVCRDVPRKLMDAASLVDHVLALRGETGLSPKALFDY